MRTVSEIIVGKECRVQGYLSTKYPTETASGNDFERKMETSLKKLDMDCIDFYHLWGILLEKYEQCVDTSDGPLVHAIKLRDQDVIRHISFSLHDKPENMIEIIKRGNEVFKSMLCQRNLLGLH